MVGTSVSHYRVLERLGAGGMGVVYKAQDTRLGRLVALKFLSPGLAGDQRALERFRREASAAAALEHPNVCTIYEIETTDAGQMFIAMPLYSGRTLKQQCADGPLSPGAALDIAIQLADGLANAHTHGIVHRDVTPANVIITAENAVKILDFGLAFLTEAGTTTASRVAGTPAYMSPEQVLGAEVDARSDVWSAGVVFYEMLTGRTPFRDEAERTVVDSILHRAPVAPSELDPGIPDVLETIILRCLQKKPAHRFASGAELLKDLKAARAALGLATALTVDSEGAVAPTPTPGEVRTAAILSVRVEPDQTGDPSGRAQCVLELGEALRARYPVAITYPSADTVHAVFGAPTAVEHAPRQAVSAAIELRRELGRIVGPRLSGHGPRTRMAVHVGEVVVNAAAHRDHCLITGQAIDESGALLETCAPGKTVVSVTTYQHTADAFSYGPPLTPTKRQGRAVHELLSTHPEEALPAKRVIDSEMVGRHSQLDQLRLNVFKLLNGTGTVVSVIGDAGIGKSRILSELMSKEEMQRVSVLTGRAVPFGEHLSFHPLTGILKQWAGITEIDNAETAFSKVEQAVRWTMAADAVQEVLPFVATVLGLTLPPWVGPICGIDGQGLEKLICANLRRLFAAVAAHRPLLIAIEDLHWADASTLNLMTCLLRLVPETRVLFVFTARPGYPSSERLLTAIRTRYAESYAEIVLEPLSARDAESMLANLLKTDQVPHALKAAVLAKSGRNPLFLEELVRSLIESGAIGRSDQEFTFGDVDHAAIPETIAETILSRVDRLSLESRSLLKLAAVIGPVIAERVLLAIAGVRTGLTTALQGLEDADILTSREQVGEREYLFRHALMQEVVYQAIVPGQRADLHLKIARAIETTFSSRIAEFYGMLAYHYVRGQDEKNAYSYLMRAGDHALQTSASAEAVQYYKNALDIYLKTTSWKDPTKVAALEKNIALAYYNKGVYSDALAHFDRLHPLVLGPVPRHMLARWWTAAVGLMHVLIGVYIPSLKWKREPTAADEDWVNLFYCKLMAMGHLDPRRVVVEALLLAGKVTRFDLRRVRNGVAMFAGLSLAFSWTGVSLRLSRRILSFLADKIDTSDDKAVLYYRTDLLTLNFFDGVWCTSSLDEDVVIRGKRIGEIFSLANFVVFHGRMAIEQGRFIEVERTAAVLQQLSSTFDHEYPLALAHFLRAKLYMKQRRAQEGLEAAAEGLQLATQLGLSTLVLGLRAIRARLLLMAGDGSAAKSELARGTELLKQIRATPCYRGEFLLAALELALAESSGDGRLQQRADVLNLGHKAVRNAATVASDQAEAHRLLGRCHVAAGNRSRALNALAASLEIAGRLGARVELARTHAEIARHLSDSEPDRRVAKLTRAEHIQRAIDLERELAGESAAVGAAPENR